MRLPHRGPFTDVEQTKVMVDAFLEAGFTYFDTAHVYIGSEDAVRKALVKRHPRERYTLATKLFAAVAPTENAAKEQLFTSLRRTGAEYIDYYLLHSLMDSNVRIYERYHLWDYVREQKEKGLIRHYGFSFHGGPALLDRLLTEHPDVEFVQLQLNYADWESPTVQSRANYEVARKHGKPIVVMEPVKGGHLARPPKEIERLMREHHPEASPASWAIRFAASLDGVLAVLSGMSNTAQMQDNLSYMKDFRPLDEAERRVIHEAQRILGASPLIPCTGCRYCVKGCPKGIPIPDVFAAMNKRLGSGLISEAAADYQALPVNAGACVACRQCEKVCPQHLEIVDQLKECGEALGS
ncbi:MAG: aldo/keto reductase [Clostridia bacterium]|nr:aldo/keto reductase [Clostridia bacterium]